MNWWGWVIAGAILLGAELGFVNAQFYLVFIGSAALLVGLITAADPILAAWAQWACFALLAVVSMVGFRNRIYRRVHTTSTPVAVGLTGAVLTIPVELAPGATCQVEHGGTFWTARNDGDRSIAAGTRARISFVQGLTLLVQPDV